MSLFEYIAVIVAVIIGLYRVRLKSSRSIMQPVATSGSW
jgi:hypothetical protein